MPKTRVLNLYSGIGGNRKLWRDCDVTAVELDSKIAAVYSHLFPGDTVVVADAHQFLLENFMNYDFIWSSPPCPSHSRARWAIASTTDKLLPVYPDLKLYEEILLLQHYCPGKYVVENVIPFYSPLVSPSVSLGHHYFWSNFDIPALNFKRYGVSEVSYGHLARLFGYDLALLKGLDKRVVLRNAINPELGNYIFDCACDVGTSHYQQLNLFADVNFA